MNRTNIKKTQIKKALDEAYAYPVSNNVMKIMMDRLNGMSPSLICEIGTGYGISTAMFAEAFPKALIVTYEKSLDRLEKAQAYFNCLHLDNIQALHADAKEAEFPEGIDVAFIDASKAHHQLFLEKILKKASNQSVIFIDNMHISRIHTEKTTRSRRALIKKHTAFKLWLEAQTHLNIHHYDLEDGLTVITTS